MVRDIFLLYWFISSIRVLSAIEFRASTGSSDGLFTRFWVKTLISLSNNLSDLPDAGTARTNLDVYSTAEVDTAIDTDIATHTALTSAHHARYTDAEAVSALDTADVYVKIAGDTMVGPNSTTFLQIQQADTSVVFNVDTTNARVGIGTATPQELLHVGTGKMHLIYRQLIY